MKIKGSILILGASGLVGSAVYRKLLDYGVPRDKIDAPTSRQLNLLTMEGEDNYKKPYNYIINCAGRVGGIIANHEQKYDFIHDNMTMQLNAMKIVQKSSYYDYLKKYVFLGSSCIYPNTFSVPIKETDLMTGPLEKTNDAYAIAKIAGIKLGQTFFEATNTPEKFSAVMPCNVYGQHDRYMPGSHVIPDLIQKFLKAKPETSVKLYGTGAPLREFIYSDDLADAIIRIALYDGFEDMSIVNVGTDFEISIKDLAEKIKGLIPASPVTYFDKSYPDGTMRKKLDTTKMERVLGWKAKTDLDSGLVKAMQWYLDYKL
jgi:GDP-L-fucose synthase